MDLESDILEVWSSALNLCTMGLLCLASLLQPQFEASPGGMRWSSFCWTQTPDALHTASPTCMHPPSTSQGRNYLHPTAWGEGGDAVTLGNMSGIPSWQLAKLGLSTSDSHPFHRRGIPVRNSYLQATPTGALPTWTTCWPSGTLQAWSWSCLKDQYSIFVPWLFSSPVCPVAVLSRPMCPHVFLKPGLEFSGYLSCEQQRQALIMASAYWFLSPLYILEDRWVRDNTRGCVKAPFLSPWLSGQFPITSWVAWAQCQLQHHSVIQGAR